MYEWKCTVLATSITQMVSIIKAVDLLDFYQFLIPVFFVFVCWVHKGKAVVSVTLSCLREPSIHLNFSAMNDYEKGPHCKFGTDFLLPFDSHKLHYITFSSLLAPMFFTISAWNRSSTLLLGWNKNHKKENIPLDLEQNFAI